MRAQRSQSSETRTCSHTCARARAPHAATPCARARRTEQGHRLAADPERQERGRRRLEVVRDHLGGDGEHLHTVDPEDPAPGLAVQLERGRGAHGQLPRPPRRRAQRKPGWARRRRGGGQGGWVGRRRTGWRRARAPRASGTTWLLGDRVGGGVCDRRCRLSGARPRASARLRARATRALGGTQGSNYAQIPPKNSK